MAWTSTDQIGVFNSSNSQSVFTPNLSSGTTAETAYFTGNVSGEISAAYYPYSSSVTDPTAIPYTIGNQTYSGVSSLSDTDVKVGVKNGTTDDGEYDIDFYPIATMLYFIVNTDGCTAFNYTSSETSSSDYWPTTTTTTIEPYTLSSVKIQDASKTNGIWAGSFTFDATAGTEATLVSDTPSDKITVTLGSSSTGLEISSNQVAFYVAIAPGLNLQDKLRLSIIGKNKKSVVTTNYWGQTSSTSSYVEVQVHLTLTLSQTLKKGYVYTVPLNLSRAEENPTDYEYVSGDDTWKLDSSIGDEEDY